MRHDDLPAEVALHASRVAREVDATAALWELARLAHVVETETVRYVERARSEGRSWAQIGDVLGVTRQAAQQRYGH